MRLFATLLCAFCLVAFESRSADGELFATVYRALPAGSAIAVRPWDNSDDNLKLAEAISGELRNAGYRVVKDSPFVLSFETRDQIGTWSAGGQRSVLELQGSTGRGEGENARVRLNLYSSDQGGVLNRGDESGKVVPSKYQLEMTLDGPDGVRYWLGQAIADLERSDGLSLTRSMVPALIRQFGRNAPAQTFEIR